MTDKTDNKELRELEHILNVQKKFDPKLEDNIENVLDWKTPMSFFEKAIAQARQEGGKEAIEEVRDQATQCALDTFEIPDRIRLGHLDDILDRPKASEAKELK
jgi:hypothetical protein